MVEVRLHEPIPVDDEDDPRCVVGYLRNFGLRVREGELVPLLEKTIDDGEIRWDLTEYAPVEPNDLDRAVRRRIEAVTPGGVWYVSGRVFYRDEEDEDPRTVQ